MFDDLLSIPLKGMFLECLPNKMGIESDEGGRLIPPVCDFPRSSNDAKPLVPNQWRETMIPRGG